MTDRMLYEVCPVCEGTGVWKLPGGDCECEVCKPLRVMPVGVTAAQLSLMHSENGRLKERVENLPKEIEKNLAYDMARTSVNCGSSSSCSVANWRIDAIKQREAAEKREQLQSETKEG